MSGTRALTIIHNEDNETVVTILRFFDGYPRGHGLDLAKFLCTPGILREMGILAIDLITHLRRKKHLGGLEIITPLLILIPKHDYEYHIYPDKIIIKDTELHYPIFAGPWEELKYFCKHFEG